MPLTLHRILPSRLLPQDAPALHGMLMTLRGQPVDLDASAVAQLATPCVQVLLSAARSWREDGVALGLIAPSSEMLAVLEHLAVEPAALEAGGA